MVYFSIVPRCDCHGIKSIRLLKGRAFLNEGIIDGNDKDFANVLDLGMTDVTGNVGI